MAHTVRSYSILLYESPCGYQTNRAQIQMNGTGGKVGHISKNCRAEITITQLQIHLGGSHV